MPFQSEKQRRFLHANHPEIAKRWEREYATGGISNHFKLKDGGRIGFRRGTSGAPGGGDPGMHSSSGDVGGAANPSGPAHLSHNAPVAAPTYQNVHQTGAITQTPGRTVISTPKDGPKKIDLPKDGPPRILSKEEAYSKAVAEGELVAREMALRKQHKKKKVDHLKKIQAFGVNEYENLIKPGVVAYQKKHMPTYDSEGSDLQIENLLSNLDLIETLRGTKKSNRTSKNYLTDVEEFYSGVKPEFAGYIREDIKPKGSVEKSVYDYAIKEGIGAKEFKSWYDTLDAKGNKQNKNFANDIYKELQLSDKIETVGKDYVENLDIKGKNKFDDQREAFDILSNKISTGKKEGKNTSNLKKDYLDNKDEYDDLGITNMDEFKILLEKTFKEGGVARKNYFHGGILDINESEEIISDDGNDIELTDYNAAFDDPNDLSTGVKSLFRAKDGGTPQLAQKSKSGKRSGYAGNPFGYSDTPAHHGDVAHGDQGRFNQPSAPVQTQTVTSTSTGGDQEDDTAEMMRKMALKDLVETGPGTDVEKYDTFGLKVQDKWSGTYSGTIKKSQALVNNARSQWEKVKDSMNEKYKKKVGQKIIQGLLMGGVSFGIGDLIGVMVDGYKTNKAKQEFIGVINDTIAEYTKLGIPEHSPHTDTLIQTLNQEILDLTQKGDQDDIDRNEFIYKPLTGEVGEEYAQGDYDSDTNAQAQWSNWNAMKQKQALNANLQEQWRAEKEASDQSFLVANSGGLANLFRVKNQ